MKVLLQRVSAASVEVDRQRIAHIGRGLLLLIGIEELDAESDLDWMAGKIARLRVFSDADGKMNLSLSDVGGEALAVSQFTLLASYKKGNRPSFSAAAPPERALQLFDDFVRKLETLLKRDVPKGVFGADMQIALVNDGPVTLYLDSKQPA